jgi:hypothetical protein
MGGREFSMSTSEQAVCAHLNVLYKPILVDGTESGRHQDYWECRDCKQAFWPQLPSQNVIMERAALATVAAPQEAAAQPRREEGLREARHEEAQWWYDYFFGKPQSGKLGIERLQEARERLAMWAASPASGEGK